MALTFQTGLDGTGVLIGLADISRSGKAGYDAAERAAPNTIPAGVYHKNNAGMDPMYNTGANNLINEHGTIVASVMIDSSILRRGVAPMAQLHSIGLGFAGTDPG